MSRLLDGQTAIVTGGGRGFGRAIAQTLAQCGAAVVVASRNAPELDTVVLAIKKAGGRALAQTADVADERQAQDLVLAAERWVGPVSILVNNAGVLEPLMPLARSRASTWLRTIAINVGGTYLATRAVLPGMVERGYGRIVNISSGAALNARASWTAYAAAKAAVDSLTRTLAGELEGSGVTVCAIRPGRMDTAMTERVRRTSAEDFADVETYREETGSGKLRDPRVVARAVAHLCSREAQRNGQIVAFGDAELDASISRSLGAGA